MTELGDETWQKDMVGSEWVSNEGTLWFKGPHEKYLFRNLGNDDVYYNNQVIRLLQNYRSAYMQLAVHHYMEYQKLEAVKNAEAAESKRTKVEEVLDKMSENLPEHTIRMDNRDLHYQVGRLYFGVGNKEKFKNVLDELVERSDNTVRHRVEYAQSYMELNEYETSLEILNKMYNTYLALESKIIAGGRERKNVNTKVWNQYRKNFPDIVSHLVITYRKLELDNEAKDLLTSWLERNPEDKEAKKLLKELEG